MKREFKVWYLRNKRCRKPLFMEVLAPNKDEALFEGRRKLKGGAVILNALERQEK